MGDNHERNILQLLRYMVKGHNEASQRQVETTRLPQQTLEVLIQLVGKCGNMNGVAQGGPNGSHWGDRIHRE
jgi:hypothetical protein